MTRAWISARWAELIREGYARSVCTTGSATPVLGDGDGSATSSVTAR